MSSGAEKFEIVSLPHMKAFPWRGSVRVETALSQLILECASRFTKCTQRGYLHLLTTKLEELVVRGCSEVGTSKYLESFT